MAGAAVRLMPRPGWHLDRGGDVSEARGVSCCRRDERVLHSGCCRVRATCCAHLLLPNEGDLEAVVDVIVADCGDLRLWW